MNYKYSSGERNRNPVISSLFTIYVSANIFLAMGVVGWNQINNYYERVSAHYYTQALRAADINGDGLVDSNELRNLKKSIDHLTSDGKIMNQRELERVLANLS